MTVESFVNSFIARSRRERLIFELSSPARRSDGLERFCHHAEDLVESSKIRLEGQDLEFRPDFRDFVKRHSGKCLLISPDPNLDNLELPLEKAVESAAMGCDAAIIIGIDFAIVFGEAEKGGRAKFLMY